MRNALLTVLGIVDFLANLPYIVDTYKGKTKPNIASWSTLTLINALTAGAGFAAGNAFNTAILGVSYFVGSSVIFGIAVYKGTRSYTRFDIIFQVLAVGGTILWLLMRNPDIALATVIIVGELAAVPMYRHAYQYPDEETWSTFLVAALTAVGALLLATNISFASVAVPVSLVVGNGFLTGIILIRRSGKAVKVKRTEHII
ncbi:MAG: hypothetical protein WDN27_04660 [Candidatus Saccharibacteria bacterium]